jgi:hypothetical protein
MPELTIEHVLGFLDGRIETARRDSNWTRPEKQARLAAYEDIKAYILIEGISPE